MLLRPRSTATPAGRTRRPSGRRLRRDRPRPRAASCGRAADRQRPPASCSSAPTSRCSPAAAGATPTSVGRLPTARRALSPSAASPRCSTPGSLASRPRRPGGATSSATCELLRRADAEAPLPLRVHLMIPAPSRPAKSRAHRRAPGALAADPRDPPQALRRRRPRQPRCGALPPLRRRPRTPRACHA